MTITDFTKKTASKNTSLDDWLESSISLNIERKTAIIEIYDDYLNYMRSVQKIPLTRKTFVTTLKKLLSRQILEQKVSFVHRDVSMAKGLYLQSEKEEKIEQVL